MFLHALNDQVSNPVLVYSLCVAKKPHGCIVHLEDRQIKRGKLIYMQNKTVLKLD